ncbi:MAG: RNA polymerase factor sigma-54 [Bacteroidetes bacterium]|nr:RNA polymerase factor sigma-54 [Bacteroidota bacterium]MDA0879372.1 RNA polymerase factor sigma-54 [Bacteroidota bacterium]
MLKQYLHLKQTQKLSPQQIQLMKMIKLPTLDFEQRIKQELEENPALESGKENDPLDEQDNFDDSSDYDDNEYINADDINVDEYLSDDDIPDYRTKSNNYSEDDQQKTIPIAAETSLSQHLINQLYGFRFESEELEIAEFLIGSIDDSGYIRRDLGQIVDDLAFTQNIMVELDVVEQVLKRIQHLDPSGVGARDLQECLSIQLQRKSRTSDQAVALLIIDNHFDLFSKKHYDKLMSKLELTEEQLKSAIAEIERLNPKPGSSFAGQNKNIEQIIPDFIMKIVDGDLDLKLNGRNAPELHVSHSYNEMLKGYKASLDKSKAQHDAVMFIKQKLDAAKWFIDAVQQRQQTLMLTMSAIMAHQKEYFLSGDEKDLKPMILKDIADEINMDVSTVSRVANGKYVDTPYGTKILKSFFSESMTNDQGEEVSTREIKSILKTLVDQEDKKKPITDEQLAIELKNEGYPIARRTVAKYREQLDIPVARLRKQL